MPILNKKTSEHILEWLWSFSSAEKAWPCCCNCMMHSSVVSSFCLLTWTTPLCHAHSIKTTDISKQLLGANHALKNIPNNGIPFIICAANEGAFDSGEQRHQLSSYSSNIASPDIPDVLRELSLKAQTGFKEMLQLLWILVGEEGCAASVCSLQSLPMAAEEIFYLTVFSNIYHSAI